MARRCGPGRQLFRSSYPATKRLTPDYSINFFEPMSLLIAHMRYIGDDFEADMASIKDCPVTRRWWELTDGMQESLVPGATGSKDGRWWADCEEVFRMEG